MSEQLKIFKVNHKICWGVFITLQLFIVAIMIGTLSHPYWVELDPDGDSFDFKGSLIYVKEGLTAVPNLINPLAPLDLKDRTFLRIACGACFVRDLLDEEITAESTWNLYHSWCSMTSRLWFAAGLFIVFEVIALLCLAAMIFFMVMFIRNVFYLKWIFYAGGCMWASHYVAIIGWIIFAHITFGDDCHDLYDGTNPPIVCARTGPRIGLFVLIFIPVVMIPFFIVTCHIKRAKLVQERSIQSERAESNNNMTDIADARSGSPVKS